MMNIVLYHAVLPTLVALLVNSLACRTRPAIARAWSGVRHRAVYRSVQRSLDGKGRTLSGTRYHSVGDHWLVAQTDRGLVSVELTRSENVCWRVVQRGPAWALQSRPRVYGWACLYPWTYVTYQLNTTLLTRRAWWTEDPTTLASTTRRIVNLRG